MSNENPTYNFKRHEIKHEIWNRERLQFLICQRFMKNDTKNDIGRS